MIKNLKYNLGLEHIFIIVLWTITVVVKGASHLDGRFWNRYGFGIITAVLLTGYTGYALLDTFVIPHKYAVVEAQDELSDELQTEDSRQTTKDAQTVIAESAGEAQTKATESTEEARAKATESGEEAKVTETDEETQASINNQADKTQAVITDNSYRDENISVELSEYRVNDTTIHVADIKLDDISCLKTAFAYDMYGRNIKAETSEIAREHNAILAVNGDFYGARNTGYVIRQGTLYRSKSSGNEDLVIYRDGSFEIIDENAISAQELLEKGAWNVFSFGPALLIDGEIAVTSDEEVGKAMASNPRTAMGIIEEGHYLMVVSDGRTRQSEGLSLRELAQFMQELCVETAYNLDGGGSSTMVFMGDVINNPTTGGQRISERSVSDIIYVGE